MTGSTAVEDRDSFSKEKRAGIQHTVSPSTVSRMTRSKKRALTILPIQHERHKKTPRNLGVHKTLGVWPEHLMGNGEKKPPRRLTFIFGPYFLFFSSVFHCCRGTAPALCEKTAHRLVC